MEAAGLPLIFHQTSALLPEVVKHLREQVFQILLVDGARSVQAMETTVGEVERRAELMSG